MLPSEVSFFDEDSPAFNIGSPALTPTQSASAAQLVSAVSCARVNIFRASAGMGRTTVLRAVHASIGGHLMSGRQVRNSQALKASARSLPARKTVLVDDFHVIATDLGDLTIFLDHALNQDTTLVFGSDSAALPVEISRCSVVWELGAFGPGDYAAIADYYLGAAAAAINFDRVQRVAVCLTATQCANACLFLGLREDPPDTQSFIDYLRCRESAALCPEQTMSLSRRAHA